MKKLNNLPDTLSQEQILELFKQYQEGNLKAKETILVHNIKLIINLVLIQFNYPQYDVDELICVGLTSLTESIDNYDITRKANFSTFARYCAKNKIISYLKRNNKHTKNISLNTTLYTSFDGDETTIEDTLQDYSSDIQTDYEDKEEIQIIRELIENLPEREKFIIKLYYGFNCKKHTLKEIGAKLNISGQFTQVILKRTLNNLREQLTGFQLTKTNK